MCADTSHQLKSPFKGEIFVKNDIKKKEDSIAVEKIAVLKKELVWDVENMLGRLQAPCSKLSAARRGRGAGFLHANHPNHSSEGNF